jgi:glyceraldehyde 3-phosphate dehydrogenase/glyceraldehyde-3-phosphate dehydrogenase (NAD(P))
MKKIAINGMGRTGRLMLRRALSGAVPNLDVVAVNDIAAPDDVAYLMKYDSVHGRLNVPVAFEGGRLQIGDRSVHLFRERDPRSLPWRELSIDVVIESTGQFTERANAARHLDAGARRVLVSAPSPDADVTLVMGVNDPAFDARKHFVVSNASCTTNSLAPPLKVLIDRFGVAAVTATTVHAYTASQAVVDKPAKKKHRGRAAAVSIIPTSTGADAATVQVLPRLANRIRVAAMRVPVPNGSVTDITAQLDRDASREEVNAALREAANGAMKGILGFTEEELVSADILGESLSGIVHANATAVVGRLARILVWYDNEVGYGCRCLDLAARGDF